MDGFDAFDIDLDPARPGSGLKARIGVLFGIAVLVGAGALIVWQLGSDDGGPERAGDDADGVTFVDPAGPYDGLESIGLPVVVDPSVGLVDGQTVSVTASGFPEGTDVAIVQCWGLGDGSGSAVNCDAGNYALSNADEQGVVSAEYVVRRFISTELGQKDCAAEDPLNSCGIAVANINDYDQSGVTTTYFDPSVAGQPAALLVVEPTSGLQDGDIVTVTGSNFEPGVPARITQCVMNTSGLPGCFSSNPTGEIAVDGQGNFVVTLEARRLVDGLTGTVDCVEDPYGCSVVVASTKIPNPVWLTFDGAPRPPSDPSFTVIPSSGLVDGSMVALELTDLRGADGAYVIQQCVDVQGGPSCHDIGSGVGSDGTITTSVTVTRELLIDDGTTRDCAEPGRRCYLRVETEYQEVERLPIDFEVVG